MELYDMVRLIGSAIISLEAVTTLPEMRKQLVRRKLTGYIALLRSVTGITETTTIAQAHTAYKKYHNKLRAMKLVRSEPAFAAAMRPGGLLELFFHTLASRFIVARKPSGVLFDSDLSPFAHGDIVLEGIHTEPIIVGRPASARPAVATRRGPPRASKKTQTPKPKRKAGASP